MNPPLQKIASRLNPGQSYLVWVISALLPALFLEGISILASKPFSWWGLGIRLIFVLLILLLTRIPRLFAQTGWLRSNSVLIFTGLLIGSFYLAKTNTPSGWILIVIAYALLITLVASLVQGQPLWARFGFVALAAIVAGVGPVTFVQIETRFSDEEFFVALQALVLGLFWLLLYFAAMIANSNTRIQKQAPMINLRVAAPILVVLFFGGMIGTIDAYQKSFYPGQAPVYPGITPENPFLCGSVNPVEETYSGVDLYNRLLALVEANPDKRSPEYGMLALGTGEARWAKAFHASLLQEARDGAFAGPAGSLKYVQFEASERIYYYAKIQVAFPGLFSNQEVAELHDWFAAINRRAQTPEWVDFMYALAFRARPQGPYWNQETGAGLLALLESQNLSDPDISQKNQTYLSNNPGGWEMRFRNTDDAIVYQPEWLYNAYFQSIYTGRMPEKQARLSFEWLLLQALPDGAPLQYNHPASAPLAGIAYLGAQLLGDENLLWVAGRSIAQLESRGKYLGAKPGIDGALELTGSSPDQGSCLLYGDSGLPDQSGPLAPDKIVFRDGWSQDSTYLLLNLRFTGWHRYKATNTITLMYQDGPLASDQLEGETSEWLPVGRSLFRDKRIPRENLNGLLVEQEGLGAVTHALTGIGADWAQDPPYYAEVKEFNTGEDIDSSSTVIEDWHGWTHQRDVYFYHGGPVLIVDEARGPANSDAALAWHFYSETGQFQNQRLQLLSGPHPYEVLFLPTGDGEVSLEKTTGELGEFPNLNLVYHTLEPGRLSLITVFLPESWIGGTASFLNQDGKTWLKIESGENQVQIPLPAENSGK